MADSQVFRSFLVSLGFKVDTTSQNSFKNATGAATKQVNELASALKSAAITAAIIKIAKGFEDLFYVSQRVKGSAGNIDAFGKAVSQLGGSAEGATGSLESLARNLRTAPGNYGLLESLGVRTKDANGQLRDTVDMMADVGRSLRSMDFYKANAYAGHLGIDERTLIAMRDGSFDAQLSKYQRMRSELGLSGIQAAKDGKDSMNALRDIIVTLQLVMEKLAIEAGKVLLPILKGVSNAFTDLLKKYNSLDKATKDQIARMAAYGAGFIALAVTAGLALKAIGLAWSLLNLRFLASPIGIILALAAAFALLAEDYMVWKEGGKSAFDWTGWGPQIKEVTDAIGGLKDAILDLWSYAEPKLKQLSEFLGIGNGKFMSTTLYEVQVLTKVIKGDFKGAGELIDQNKADYAAKQAAETSAAKGTPNKDASQPRGIRNNNPGNISFTPMMEKHFGAELEDHPKARFSMFKTAQDGLNALAVQIKRYANAGMKSVRSIIAKFAPASENNTPAYIGNVARKLGVDQNQQLNVADPQIMATLMDAIVKVENGKNPYASDMMARAAQVGTAHEGRFGGGWGNSPPIQQTNHITVTGVSNPQEAATRVQGAQKSSNEQLVRQVQVAVQ